MSNKVIEVPKLVNNRGTLPIARSYRGIGRIRIASGTTDPKTYIKIVEAMDSLYGSGKLTALEELRDGSVAPIQLFHALTQTGIQNIGSLKSAAPLKSTMNAWLVTHAVKETTRKSYKAALSQFLTLASDSHLVRDIPSVLKRYKRRCQRNQTHKMMELVRMICLAFARTEYGKHNDLYREIESIEPLPRINKVKNDAVSVADIKLLMTCMPEHHAHTMWNMCVTGMRISEFFETSGATWTLESDCITICGTKTSSSERVVFRMEGVDKPTTGELSFRRALSTARKHKDVGDLSHITPHTFRKCFAYWLSAAGIIPPHQQMYMGHNASTMTAHYQKTDITPFLKQDADAFSRYLIEEGRKTVDHSTDEFFSYA